MRILYLHQYFNTPRMMGATRSYELSRRMAAAGHEVHVITSTREDRGPRGAPWRETVEARVKVHWTPVPYSNRMSYRKRLEAFAAYAWRAAGRAVEIGGDLVFATSTPLTVALPAVWVRLRLRIPMVFEVRDLWPTVPAAMGVLRPGLQLSAARALERFAYRNAEHIIALSPGMRDGILRAGVPPERVTVVPNGCDNELFAGSEARGAALRQRYDWLGNRPLVLYAGTLGHVNGVGYLARIAQAMLEHNPDVRFLVVGGGGDEPQVRDTALQAGVLDRNFFMLPPMAKEDVVACFSAADLATSTVIDLVELWDNSANKFFDALAAGTPVMINHEGWQADILRETGAGIVVPPDDPSAAAHHLAAFLNDEHRLACASEAALRLARDMFDRDILFERLRLVIERVVGASQS